MKRALLFFLACMSIHSPAQADIIDTARYYTTLNPYVYPFLKPVAWALLSAGGIGSLMKLSKKRAQLRKELSDAQKAKKDPQAIKNIRQKMLRNIIYMLLAFLATVGGGYGAYEALPAAVRYHHDRNWGDRTMLWRAMRSQGSCGTQVLRAMSREGATFLPDYTSRWQHAVYHPSQALKNVIQRALADKNPRVTEALIAASRQEDGDSIKSNLIASAKTNFLNKGLINYVLELATQDELPQKGTMSDQALNALMQMHQRAIKLPQEQAIGALMTKYQNKVDISQASQEKSVGHLQWLRQHGIPRSHLSEGKSAAFLDRLNASNASDETVAYLASEGTTFGSEKDWQKLVILSRDGNDAAKDFFWKYIRSVTEDTSRVDEDFGRVACALRVLAKSSENSDLKEQTFKALASFVIPSQVDESSEQLQLLATYALTDTNAMELLASKAIPVRTGSGTFYVSPQRVPLIIELTRALESETLTDQTRAIALQRIADGAENMARQINKRLNRSLYNAWSKEENYKPLQKALEQAQVIARACSQDPANSQVTARIQRARDQIAEQGSPADVAS